MMASVALEEQEERPELVAFCVSSCNPLCHVVIYHGALTRGQAGTSTMLGLPNLQNCALSNLLFFINYLVCGIWL
jgi:hypothetical protein